MAIAAVYSSAHQMVITGDVTDTFCPSRKVKCDCGVDGLKYVYIGKSVYSAPDTTIDTIPTDSDDLTANLISVEVSSIKPNTNNYGNVPLEILHMHRGLKKFMLPTWNSASVLGITPGYLHINDGSLEKILVLESAITIAITGLSATTWYFIYVTAPANNGIILSSGDFSLSTTVPTYSTTKCGFYDGNNRCIGFFKSNATNTMWFFQTDGYFYKWNAQGSVNNSLSASWTTYTLDVPLPSQLYEISGCTEAEASYIALYFKCADDTVTTSNWFIYDSYINHKNASGQAIIKVNASKQISVYGNGVAVSYTIHCNGMMLPKGFAIW